MRLIVAMVVGDAIGLLLGVIWLNWRAFCERR
jgi:hypothetical protein